MVAIRAQWVSKSVGGEGSSWDGVEHDWRADFGFKDRLHFIIYYNCFKKLTISLEEKLSGKRYTKQLVSILSELTQILAH